MNKKGAFFLILCLLVLVVFLPQIASTRLGKPLFTKNMERKTQADIEIGSLHLSWFGPQKFKQVKWSREALSGTIEELQIKAPFWSFSGPFILKEASVNYQGGKIEQIEGQIEDHDFELKGTTLQGYIALKGKVDTKADFQIAIDVKNFPTEAIHSNASEILGPVLSAQGHVSMKRGKGSADVQLDSSHLKTEVHAFFTEREITLQEPLIASIRLTPALSSLLLKDTNPLFLTGIQAENPVYLRIEPKDFFFPLPFSLGKFHLGKATLNLGKVQCRNGKSLASIIALLKAAPLSKVKAMQAWFTPMQFSIEKGRFKAGRMDVLLENSIHLCSWGSIDLIKDRVHMNLGLPADTLKRSFGIENISPNYVLKVEVRGSTKDPEIVAAPAAAKIAALVAAGQFSKKGPFGTLAEIFSSPKEEKGVPPPQRPFPWES